MARLKENGEHRTKAGGESRLPISPELPSVRPPLIILPTPPGVIRIPEKGKVIGPFLPLPPGVIEPPKKGTVIPRFSTTTPASPSGPAGMGITGLGSQVRPSGQDSLFGGFGGSEIFSGAGRITKSLSAGDSTSISLTVESWRALLFLGLALVAGYYLLK